MFAEELVCVAPGLRLVVNGSACAGPYTTVLLYSWQTHQTINQVATRNKLVLPLASRTYWWIADARLKLRCGLQFAARAL